MATERTLSIVKPDGVQKNLIGEVYRRFEQGGLQIVGLGTVRSIRSTIVLETLKESAMLPIREPEEAREHDTRKTAA